MAIGPSFPSSEIFQAPNMAEEFRRSSSIDWQLERVLDMKTGSAGEALVVDPRTTDKYTYTVGKSSLQWRQGVFVRRGNVKLYHRVT